ncbi:hypothetical protein DFJ69_6474 [Thermomonospora umbrina]|uniref:Uncharacterized protein n=1 Tax=Thermomonospora umbrina TaxID=111806 RepID=A0A3D9SYF4_9ACTN|nr:hypothetical protein DFJ69_6474 [Thermomonospora umbrina]
MVGPVRDVNVAAEGLPFGVVGVEAAIGASGGGIGAAHGLSTEFTI